MSPDQAFFSNVKNMTITGGSFNINNGPVIYTDNSKHVTNSGPVYNNYGHQIINQGAPANDNRQNAQNKGSQKPPMDDQTPKFSQSQSQYAKQNPANQRPYRHEPKSLMSADDVPTDPIDSLNFGSFTRPRDPVYAQSSSGGRTVHPVGSSGSFATVENPVIHGMSPEFQRRFESLMEMVPQAAAPPEEGNLVERNDHLNGNSMLPNPRNVDNQRDTQPENNMDVEMEDPSSDFPLNDTPAAPEGPEGSPSNVNPPDPFVNTNQQPHNTYYVDNRHYTTNINSGNISNEHTYDSYNDNSTRTEVRKQIAKKTDRAVDDA